MASLSLTCLFAAATAYHLSPQGLHALQAIRTVEGGHEHQEVCGNSDGSCDLGPFQVNDKAWVAHLANRLRADQGVVRATLRDDGCWNAQVASWIFKQELDQAGGNLPEAIGNYHSHWPTEHFRYRRKVASVIGFLDPDEPPPAMPDAGEGDSPGALRIPQDVSGPTPPAASATPTETPKGKMIIIGGQHAQSTVPPDPEHAPKDGKPPQATPPLKILRGAENSPQ